MGVSSDGGCRSLTITSLSGSLNGRGRSKTPFTTLNIAVLAPMPTARTRMAISVKPGLLISPRSPYLKSRQVSFMNSLQKELRFANFELRIAICEFAAPYSKFEIRNSQFLFVSQRHHRVDSARPASRDEAGCQSYQHQCRRDRGKSDGVG